MRGILFAHVFAPSAPQLAALAGISVSLAFGASIPIEVISDTPGVGQLAWKAAMDRDLPLLVNITCAGGIDDAGSETAWPTWRWWLRKTATAGEAA